MNYPSIDVLIEDFGQETGRLCLCCRKANPPRFNLLQEICFEEPAPKSRGEYFYVCVYCDVSEDGRKKLDD